MPPIPIKDAAGIAGMRASCRMARTILEELCNLLEPGKTTGEIDKKAGELIAKHGARSAFLGYRKFPGQLCISVNEEVVHGIGGPRRLGYGDVVKLDVGIILDGWVGDTATTVGVGAITPARQKLLERTRAALAAGIAAARGGVKLGDVSHAVETTVKKAGYSVVREFVGHGVGRKLHEEPQIPNFGRANSGPILRPGMTLAIEPMVNEGSPEVRILKDGWTAVTADGKDSAHFEHVILITEGEPEILTESLDSDGDRKVLANSSAAQ
ncbi:MAG: type I methionyl aminopeptidase [Verrucomicrobia bacterium]|nr:type I methionyl aminopeptidase [bacterium]NDA09755.1 type I methionyl aminopeptidase [Verrucomicrobiota bacterium]NDD56597.1 type I methionyl aminopeptidase [Verrucomicrobiota bacterium]NDD81487.1 type I methionyl aminopeptidase [Verrucomicrobiota bacterium]